MQKKLASIIFSTRLTATLFIVFAIAMAVGTLVDASSETSPTPYSRALIYNAWWFEAIMGLFVVNFLGNIVRFKMFSKEKATTLVIHLSFILILVGAFVTRYIGYEGVMQINEGDTSNEILSEFAYLNVFIDGDYVIDGQQQRLKLAPKKMDLSQRLNNHFTISKTYNQTPVTITYKDFIKGATKGMIEDPDGEGYLKIVEAGDGTRHDHYVKVGEVSNIHNILFAVNKPTKGAINIFYDEQLGGRGSTPSPVKVDINGLEVYATYGSKTIELPFSITLNDFIAEKYPGTEKSYKSFKSKVTVNSADGTFQEEEIFMNNVLDKEGFRFFQSGFQPDEKGTILAVNHDMWGTWITYIGYFLLYFGLMAILFDRNSRFGNLKKYLEKIKKKKKLLACLAMLFLSTVAISQTDNHQHVTTINTQIDSLINANAVSKEHAAAFARLVIQDNGRMKPISTFASELIRKVSGSDSYNGLDANQVFMSVTQFPRLWSQVPIIKLKRGNDSIRDIVGVPKGTKTIALIDLFDKDVNFKLDPYLEAATSTNTPNQFQKDFIKAYESYYIFNQALGGSILKIFPVPADPGNKWVSYPELNESAIKGQDSMFTKTALPLYFNSLSAAKASNDYTKPAEILSLIRAYQKKHGSEVLPSDSKISAEIAYNKINIFNRLFRYFTLLGVLMFIGIIIQIFKEGPLVNGFVKVCKIVIWSFFVAMTLGLIARWYISGHAPWTDAYESIIYVAWATVFFGLAFGRKSDLTVASTAFVAAIILWVANQNWLDPAISTLVPVLDSYWLMIHVAVIVASYGPFTLGMILGVTVLILMILTNGANKAKMDLNIKELTTINELALTVGLVMLTIGNFLGGQWANESWGRYWGWDPKETWALISIMIYAFVIHMRLVPGLRGKWIYNVASIAAYGSIMMTYFGVNFYLTGLHSYASGDVPVTPSFVYYLVAFLVVLAIISYVFYRKHYIKKG